MEYFRHENYIFKLTTPKYEVPIFGYNIGELRLIQNIEFKQKEREIVEIKNLDKYIIENEIMICTYRGQEEINIIRLLMELGFIFVGTFNEVYCLKEEFISIDYKKDFGFSIARTNEFDEILNLEGKVFDYSTFQIDPLIDAEIASKRNVSRVESYFNRNGHLIFVVRLKNRIVGFQQFIVDDEKSEATSVNAAIHPNFQNLSLGVVLYSKSFSNIFKNDINIIKAGFSNQNISSSNILYFHNFKLDHQEIHLRKYI